MKHSVVQSHFDVIAPEYDEYKRRNHLYYETLIAGIQKNIKKPKPTILDIGCGTGSMLKILDPKNGVGADISPQMIKLARIKNKQQKKLSFITHNIEKKPVPGSFDYILFTDVIEHVEDKAAAIKNISKTMQTKTQLILSMANPWWEPILMLLESLQLKMPEGPHFRISEKDLKILFAKNNLEIVKKEIYFPSISIPVLKNFGLIYVYTLIKSY